MDLWIRSQDRKKLVKSSYLTLFLSDTNWFIYSDTTTGEPFEIGKYKTKERALEVLDEIQEAKLGNFHYKCPSNVKVSIKEDTFVYEMPKE